MRQSLILSAFILLTNNLFSQQKDSTTYKLDHDDVPAVENTFGLSFFLPAINLEQAVSQSTLIEYGIDIGAPLFYGYGPDRNTSLRLNSQLRVSYKWLFGRKKRMDKGRVIAGNSGWYTGCTVNASGAYFTGANVSGYGFGVAPIIGGKAVGGKRFSKFFSDWSFGVGAGMQQGLYDKPDDIIENNLELEFGVWIHFKVLFGFQLKTWSRRKK